MATDALVPTKKPNGSELAPSTPFELMTQAMSQGVTAEQLQILQDMHFKQLAWQAELDFNEALNRVQINIPRVVPDLTNPQTKSKYASFAKLDKIVRPIYTAEGFSLSFNTADCPKPDHVRIVAYLSRGKHTRTYQIDMPITTTGIRGNEMMTPIHASASANSYGKRYLECDIFNIPVGEDTDGNMPQVSDLAKRIVDIEQCSDFKKLKEVFGKHYREAKEVKDQHAEKQIVAAYEKRKLAFAKAQAEVEGVAIDWSKK